MNSINSLLFKIHRLLMNNKLSIKLYSILKWHEHFFSIKKILYLDKQLQKNEFIYTIKTGTKFYLPLYNIDSIQKEIVYKKDYYESGHLNQICSLNSNIAEKAIKDGFVLDIGSNIGNHTLFFAKEKKAKKIICFEPVKDTFRILEKNIELNNLQAIVQAHNVGVGKQKSNANIQYYDKSNIGSTQLSLANDGDIPIIAIDDIDFSERITFVKIDVEGFEQNVIEGMISTLKKHHPVLMIEIRKIFFEKINLILSDIGYTHIVIDVDVYNIGNYLYFPSTLKT